MTAPIHRTVTADSGQTFVFDAPCEAVIVEGAGHWAHLERPDRFHDEVLAFLADLPA